MYTPTGSKAIYIRWMTASIGQSPSIFGVGSNKPFKLFVIMLIYKIYQESVNEKRLKFVNV